ncbi:Quinol monooxygenase YgiN [Thermomonospora echinospora]|uniref:Quinol monooxygenase YgiN n=1 Tax=Thermomonospora echinospora TaxID=1992 RepID=A0A1H6E4S0_9ACTN|nr:putative quinol monooxygenase [Thermomonospora echinospora]SEG91875.1 Quinol monooxygenase YgiN [Thermomonospora echinospora]
MIVVSGFMEVAPDYADRFAACTRELVDATRREPGCVEYRFARSIEKAERFEVFEEFVDQAALDEHVRADHYRSWNRALKDIEVTQVSIVKYIATERTVLA